MKEVKIEIWGRVQGVNFRNTVKNYAESIGLKGYVMNREDGSVLVFAQGEKKLLDDFVAWIKDSPGFSKVVNIEIEWKDSTEVFNEFRVQRDSGFFSDKKGSLKNLFRFWKVKNGEGNNEIGLKVPLHIAIIPDGNRRWAKMQGLESSSGHYVGAEYKNLKSLFKEAKDYGVKYFSLWVFSTENWKREEKEREAIFELVARSIDKLMVEAKENKIRFRHIGRKDRLPEKLLFRFSRLERETARYDDFHIQLCIDYGGRDEIVRAANNAISKKLKNVNENIFSKLLDSAGIPEPDLIIRTGGEQRLSGFFAFQSAYSELYFTDVYFPDFTADELHKALVEYGKRIRRFGGN